MYARTYKETIFNYTVEDLMIYPFEREYLMQEPNVVRHVIGDIAVCKTQSGQFLYFDLPDYRKEFFACGSPILEKHLTPLVEMTPKVEGLLHLLDALTEQLDKYDMIAVRMENDDAENGEKIILYSYLSRAYYSLPFDQLDNICEESAAKLNQFPTNVLTEPHSVSVTKAGVVE